MAALPSCIANLFEVGNIDGSSGGSDGTGGGVTTYVTGNAIVTQMWLTTVRAAPDTVRPISDGSRTMTWTPSAGSARWDMIDESITDDTDYIQAAIPQYKFITLTAVDPQNTVSFNMQDIAASPEDVTSVTLHVRAKSSGGSAAGYLYGLWLEPSTAHYYHYAPISITLTSSFVNYQFTWTTQSTLGTAGAAWTVAAVNAYEWGVQIR